jgi:hypothetical protein
MVVLVFHTPTRIRFQKNTLSIEATHGRCFNRADAGAPFPVWHYAHLYGGYAHLYGIMPT